jgi:lipid-binding SYLF domain-containing protein
MDRRKVLSALAGAAVFGVAQGVSREAQAGTAKVRMTVGKAGFIIGGTSGNGTVTWNGRNYPITIGGMRLGLTVGVSEAWTAV